MYKTTQPEDQVKFALPLNRDTEHLYYNTALVIDANVLTEPRCWEISKINRSNSKGIAIFTCKQDNANQHTLKADYDEEGNVIAWWADWKERVVPPSQGVPDDAPRDENDYSSQPTLSSTITCSGKTQIKIGGSTKTLTVTFKDDEGDPVEYQPGEWSFLIEDKPVPKDLLIITPVSDGKVTIKFLGDDEYIGKILQAKFISGDVISSLNIEIIAL